MSCDCGAYIHPANVKRRILYGEYYFYTGWTKGGNEDIKAMLDYFKSSTVNKVVNEATREIHDYISKVKISPEVEMEFMNRSILKFLVVG